jgi:hypothetical protein
VVSRSPPLVLTSAFGGAPAVQVALAAVAATAAVQSATSPPQCTPHCSTPQAAWCTRIYTAVLQLDPVEIPSVIVDSQPATASARQAQLFQAQPLPQRHSQLQGEHWDVLFTLCLLSCQVMTCQYSLEGRSAWRRSSAASCGAWLQRCKLLRAAFDVCTISACMHDTFVVQCNQVTCLTQFRLPVDAG